MNSTRVLAIVMLVAAAGIAVPVAVNLPEAWLGGVIVLALAANGIVLLVHASK